MDSISRMPVARCENREHHFGLYDFQRGNALFQMPICHYLTFIHRFTDNDKLYLFIAGMAPPGMLVVDTNNGVLLEEKPPEENNYYDVSPALVLAERISNDKTQLIDAKTSAVKEVIPGKVAFTSNPDMLWVQKTYDRLPLWELRSMKHKTSCAIRYAWNTAMSFSQNGDSLLMSHGTSVELWDVSTCNLLKTWLFPFPEKQLRFSSSGNILAATGQWYVSLWNAATGSLITAENGSDFIQPGNGNAGITDWVAFPPTDGQILFSGYMTDSYSVEIYDFDTGALIDHFPIDGWINDHFQISRDGKILAGVSNHAVTAWNLEDGTQLKRYEQYGSVYLGPDEMIAASQTKNGMLFWNWESGNAIREILIPSGVGNYAFSPDWNMLAGASYNDDEIYLWNTQTEVLQKILYGSCIKEKQCLDSNRWLTFTPDGRVLAALGVQLDPVNRYARVASLRFWDVNSTTLLRQIPLDIPVKEFVISPDGRLLAMLGDDDVISIWGIRHNE